MAIAIYRLDIIGTNRIRAAITLIITRKNSAETKVRQKCVNAIHTLERSIIGHPLSVQLRLHFWHSLSVADKGSGLKTTKLTCYIFRNLHYTEKYFSLNTNIQRFNQLRFLKL